MRRLLVFCAVTVAILAAFAVSRRERAALAAGTGNFHAIAPDPPGCPLGPAVFFCAQVPGTQSAPATFTVDIETAVSSPAITFAAVPGESSLFAAGDFTITTNTCTGSLPAGSQCTIAIAFSPTTTGLREAALTFNGDHIINLAGAGEPLTLTPPATTPTCAETNPQDNAFTFCQEAVGAASATQTFTVTAGTAATGLSVAIVPPLPPLSSEFAAGDFTIESTTCTGTLAASGTCTVAVAFTPTTTGLRAAQLLVEDSAGDNEPVNLAGQSTTGLLITPPTSGTTCSLGSFDFCNEPSGGNTAPRTYTLMNTSGTQITGLTITPPVTPPTPAPPPPDFTVTGTSCTSVLAAGASCTINVAFTPQADGERQGTVTATDNAGDIGAVNFAGYGDDYSLALTSGQSEEVTITQGGTATYNGVVNSDGVFGQNGEQVTFDCPTTLPVNTSCVITPCPAQITPGTPATFQMVFVTSTQTVVAPNPAPGTGCSSYGPPGTTEILPAPDSSPRAPHFPTLPILAIFGTIALVSGWIMAEIGSTKTRRRVPFVFAMAGLAAAALTGCHHSTKIASPETPLGTTIMDFQAPALDASGNPLNASRPGPEIILDIVQNTAPIP